MPRKSYLRAIQRSETHSKAGFTDLRVRYLYETQTHWYFFRRLCKGTDIGRLGSRQAQLMFYSQRHPNKTRFSRGVRWSVNWEWRNGVHVMDNVILPIMQCRYQYSPQQRRCQWSRFQQSAIDREVLTQVLPWRINTRVVRSPQDSRTGSLKG